ncbi:MAG: septum formation initiator family protein [Clostridiales bacterium]|nr:septum formation initiator family protein [Candidatus Blautia equi]
MYMSGNTVRQPQEYPGRRNPVRPSHTRRTVEREPQRRVRTDREIRESRRQIERNRARAEGITKGFIVFLSVVCIALLMMGVHFLQLKSEITSKKKEVARLEAEYTDLKEENDALQSQITNNVDMRKIRQIAFGRLGMKYPSDDQKVLYETTTTSYVRQYQEVPDSK